MKCRISSPSVARTVAACVVAMGFACGGATAASAGESVSAAAAVEATLPSGTSAFDVASNPLLARNLTTESFVIRDGARIWANVTSSNSGANLIGELPLGTRVGWRYSYNSKWAMVLWYQTSEWGFMIRDSLSYDG